jgi:hypothetical protein
MLGKAAKQNSTYFIILIKQEGHDGPEIAHLYIGTQGWANLNKHGRHPFEDVS